MIIVIFAGPEGPSRRLLSITGGFRADVCKQVYKGGSGDNNNNNKKKKNNNNNNNGVVIVKFFRPGIENFTENGLRVPLQTRLFS